MITRRKALSLIEVLVTLVISSLLIGIISVNFPMLKKFSDRFVEQALFAKQYYIFLLMLEGEYQQAELLDQSDLTQLDKLRFIMDSNLDGDYLDAGEDIGYRWNKKARRIDRKSGKSNYQSLLEGIDGFSWERVGNQPVCHELSISDFYSANPKRTRFCRYENL